MKELFALAKQAKFKPFSAYWDINLLAFRMPWQRDEFSDFAVVVVNSPAGWISRAFPITTRPGGMLFSGPAANPEGIAILQPGSYKYKLGEHKGKPALVQAAPVNLARDNDGNGVPLTDAEMAALAEHPQWAGINIHRAGAASRSVGRWSAGCQVFQVEQDLEWVLGMVRQQAVAGLGDSVTYRLLLASDFPRFSTREAILSAFNDPFPGK